MLLLSVAPISSAAGITDLSPSSLASYGLPPPPHPTLTPELHRVYNPNPRTSSCFQPLLRRSLHRRSLRLKASVVLTLSAFMIGGRKLITNAHCVEHDTQVINSCQLFHYCGLLQVKVKRRGDDTKYVAKVLARGIDCDIALLSVESDEFWRDVEPLRLGRLLHLQDSVTVVGYPLGGDTISVTKGVVSRIECSVIEKTCNRVTSYAHGSSDLLGIQIDAAINPSNSGGPAFNDQGECIGVAFQASSESDFVIFVAYARSWARLGPIPMAAFQTCLQVWLTSSLLADGLAVAVQEILACAFAEKNFDKVTAEGSKGEEKAGN
ncbi:hypothetical protein Ahy_A02g007384 [Arachis hypogaea]|uniref:Serine protease n=1 Tax=Arachis hypogaea TaxID=3818 RepID=A0A445ECD9_ARAHY|nr:hypothetical protein Ahy_A02g007384 [Arachis hypogaea]